MPRTKYSLKGKLRKRNFWIRVCTLFKFCDHFNCSPSSQKHLLHHLLCCDTAKACALSAGVDSAAETILVKTCFKFYQSNHYVIMIKEPQMYHLIQPTSPSSHGLCAAGKQKTVSTLLLATHGPKYKALEKLYPEHSLDMRYRKYTHSPHAQI